MKLLRLLHAGDRYNLYTQDCEAPVVVFINVMLPLGSYTMYCDGNVLLRIDVNPDPTFNVLNMSEKVTYLKNLLSTREDIMSKLN